MDERGRVDWVGLHALVGAIEALVGTGHELAGSSRAAMA
jgi:hypothetical protein